jgi:hypothetical protein
VGLLVWRPLSGREGLCLGGCEKGWGKLGKALGKNWGVVVLAWSK